jgi:hypothetical protein
MHTFMAFVAKRQSIEHKAAPLTSYTAFGPSVAAPFGPMASWAPVNFVSTNTQSA